MIKKKLSRNYENLDKLFELQIFSDSLCIIIATKKVEAIKGFLYMIIYATQTKYPQKLI